ncbi:methyl-accepting chemotaxis protein [Cryptosporangium sp. NPDC048952]|uniref:methyl-accepting chemotaxis protein n=1 Tax=Cryptosporangium sp. NPDC048952 TaxID=3363961 RepID=UPI003714C3E3
MPSLAQAFSGLQMKHRLLALGVGGVVATAIVLVIVGAWQTNAFSAHARDNVSALSTADLDHVAQGVDRLTTTAGDAIQAQVNQGMTVALAELRQRGGVQLSGTTATWTATNQTTQAKRSATLPRLLVGGTWLGQNRNLAVRTPLVDDIYGMVGGTVTVFQRMNSAGDLLRVATNVKAKTGNRAIGTFIPATAADGTPNAVAAAIKAGKPYRGVAKVVDTWQVSAYNPLKNASGQVIGAIYVGTPQSEATASLRDAIAATKVGENGGVTVYSTLTADKGRVIAATAADRVGADALEEQDADGKAYVQDIIERATALDANQTTNAFYRLPGISTDTPARTQVAISYYAAYGWAIEVASYLPDHAAAIDEINSGRTTMLWAFVIAGLLLALIGGAVAWIWARSISARMERLTGAIVGLSQRDLTVDVSVDGGDEIGRMGSALRTAIVELRGLLSGISGASTEVAGAAQRVTAAGSALAGSSNRASEQTGDATHAASEVSQNVQLVSESSEQMGAAIAEITTNAQEAAAVARESVSLSQQAGEVIAKLGESGNRIAEVVKAINGIAEQTNLLALNATIEAARAGESGKGFAVVASEVKDLAQETARATEDVTARVEEIAADTRLAVTAIEGISESIARVNDFQTAIAAAVEEQTAATGEMSRNVNVAADRSNEIARNLGDVLETVDTTRNAVQDSQQAADELNGTARHLTDLVARFRL